MTFWNCECVCVLCEKAFISKYQRWCKKYSYNFSEDRALDIYASARSHFDVMPKTDTARLLAEQAVSQLRTACAALAALKINVFNPAYHMETVIVFIPVFVLSCETAKLQMRSLASSRPEYPVVMKIFGVVPSLGSQLMAEIGDVRRFRSKTASVAFAGIDASPYQSGQIDIYIRNSASLQNFSC